MTALQNAETMVKEMMINGVIDKELASKELKNNHMMNIVTLLRNSTELKDGFNGKILTMEKWNDMLVKEKAKEEKKKLKKQIAELQKKLSTM